MIDNIYYPDDSYFEDTTTEIENYDALDDFDSIEESEDFMSDIDKGVEMFTSESEDRVDEEINEDGEPIEDMEYYDQENTL